MRATLVCVDQRRSTATRTSASGLGGRRIVRAIVLVLGY